MSNDNLPNIISYLEDGNLDTARMVDLGDRVLIIGTSPRGPVNQPIKGTTPQAVTEIFGPIEQGTLVRGYGEVYYGPNGVKDIYLCRISNGNKATLALTEKASAIPAEMQSHAAFTNDLITAMTVTALEPGDIYNSVTLRETMVNGQLSVVCYNPVSGLETVIPYDPTGARAGSVANVVALAEKINLDPNMGRIVVAEATEIAMAAQITITAADVAASGTIATPTGNTLLVDLKKALDIADDNDDGYTENAAVVSPSGVPTTASNCMIRLNDVYELADVTAQLKVASYNAITLPYPVQTNVSGTALAFLTLEGASSGGGEGKHIITNAMIGTADGTAKTFEFTAYEAIDTTTFHLYRTSAAGTTVEITAADFDITAVGGSATNYVAAVTIKTTVAAPSDGLILTVTYDSQAFALTQSATLAACRASNSYKTYFAAGDKVTFGTTQPVDLAICYPAKKTFVVDADVVLYDAVNGIVQFCNPDKQPNYVAASGSTIYYDWVYQPEWVDISTGAKSLAGGSNGIVMTNAQKYRTLATCYEALADFSTDSIVPMNTYLDDTKVVYDEETGLPVTVNAGFAAQFAAFLESLQDGVNETYGFMAVKKAASAKLADVATWVEKLTVPSSLDPTRAANVMQTANFKHLNIIAFEPVLANGAVGFAYTTTGEAVAAGICCKLPITSAPTNKSLGSQVIGCRFRLSPRQLDALTAARYWTSTLTPESEWKITDAPTAAAVGSDYARFSTVRIVFAVMDIVRTVGRPFIGEIFSAAKKAALDTAIQKGLLGMQDIGVLKTFEFKIEQTEAERVLGIARVNLVLWPEFELRRLEVTVKLSNS